MTDRQAIKYFLFLFVMAIAIFLWRFRITGFGIYGDGIGYYVYLRSVIFDRDLDFFNEFRYYQTSVSKLSGQTREIISPDKPKLTPKGYLFNDFPVGSAILWSPFYLLAHLIFRGDGYSAPYEISAGIGSMIYGFLGLIIIYKILRSFFSSSISFLSTAIIFLTTSSFYFFAFEPVRSHMLSLFLVSLFIYLWLKTLRRRSRRQWFVLGIIGGLMTMVRTQELTFVGLIILESVLKLPSGKLDYYIGLIIFAISALIAYSPQLIVQAIMWGDIFTSPYILSADKPKFLWLQPQLIKVLFSTNHGLFLWFPLTLVAFMGFLRWKSKRLIWWPLLISFLSQYYLLASYESWWQSAGFGPRMFISSNPFFSLGLASLMDKMRKKISPRLIAIILAIFIVWNFLLLGQFLLKMIPNDREFDFLVFIQNQFLLPFKVIDLIIARWLHG